MLLRWCKPHPHRTVKQPFAKENENELVNMYIWRQLTKFIRLGNILAFEVQLIATSELSACRVYLRFCLRMVKFIRTDAFRATEHYFCAKEKRPIINV